MRSVDEARAIPGRGLEGDRYFGGAGTFDGGTGHEVTLVETEAVEALERDYGIEMEPIETRRNIATRGVALNHLVGRRFRVGATVLRGVRLCEPCSHMERLAGKPARPGLVHRGGLRAEVLSPGPIRVGDPIELDGDERVSETDPAPPGPPPA